MANPIVQTTSTGAPVAVDLVGTTNFQQIKLAAGSTGMTVPIDATSGVPHASSMGLVVALKDGANVTVVAGPTTFTVNTGPTTLTVNTAPTIAGASVVAQVSGTVTISPTVLTVNTAATIAGASVTIQQGASVSAVVSGTVAISIPVSQALGTIIAVSGVTAVSVVSTVGTVLGTVRVSHVANAGDPIFVSQVNPPAGGGGSVTVAPPNISATGQIMWVVGGQSTTANPVFISHVATQVVSVVPGLSVSAVVSGTVAISIPVSQALGTIITILGTQIVSVVPGVSVNLGSLATVVGTTTAVSGATGPIVWLGASQSVLISTQVSGTVAISIPVSQALGTVITVLGTQIVTLATGGTIATLLGTVNVAMATTAAAVVTQTAIGVTGALVYLAASQTILQSVSVSVSVSVLNSGTIAVSGAIDAAVTQTNVTGAPVWLCPTQTMNMVSTVGTVAVVLGSVNVFHGAGTAVAFSYTTVVAPTVRMQPAFDIALNLTTVAATTAFVVPGGKVLRVEAIMARVQNTLASVAIANAQVFLMASTGAFTTTAPIFALLGFGNATSATGAVGFGQAMPYIIFPAGATIGMNMHVSGGSSQPFAFVVQGALYP